MTKAVLQVSYYNNRVINEFKSAAEASRELNIDKTNISAVCLGKLKSAGGYRFVFKNKLIK